MPDPEIRLDYVNSFLALGVRPQRMTGVLVSLLRQQFASADNLEDDDLAGRSSSALDAILWDSTDKTKILIESSTRWRPATTEHAPAVVVHRNDWTPQRVGINDHVYTDDTGAEHYEMLVVGSHTLFCVSNIGAECELISAEVYRNLIGFGAKIREFLQLTRFLVTKVGQLVILEEARQNYAVPITVLYAFQEKWTIRPLAPVLKTLSLSSLLP